ncbi:MAG: STAS domain-containing protein [Candidatus Omnitrophica bacterium]|nr:STAS domain-containing protein [Candidatus Omnitrophota bacterium]MBU1128022.1 STAS domain-containing protein [Candidatus Omnitrophota bacterium]MBU1784520.1 STAS domain-containing protein [Candidatus Omnitrophota bacterium]
MTYFTHEKIQGIDVIRFCFNEIGLQQREVMKKELNSVVTEDGGKVLFNLAGVGFLSSLAIATMVFFAKKVRETGGEVKLCAAKEGTKDVIKIVQLDKVFEIFDTEREALKNFTEE